MGKKFFYNLFSIFIISCALTIVICTFKNTYYATNTIERIGYYVDKVGKIKSRVNSKLNSSHEKEEISKTIKENNVNEIKKESDKENSTDKEELDNNIPEGTGLDSNGKYHKKEEENKNKSFSLNSIRDHKSEKIILKKASESSSSTSLEHTTNNKFISSENMPQMNKESGVDDPNVLDMLNNNEVPVFKVHHSKIKKSLTISDYAKIYKIARKLNIRDFMKVKDDFEAKDQEQGILNALYLLKDKLSEDDYAEVRQIADKFVDMDVVEERYSSR